MAERGRLTGELVEKMAGIDDAVARRLLRLVSWRDGVPTRFWAQELVAVAVRASGGEEANGAEEEEGPSAPLFIGEAW